MSWDGPALDRSWEFQQFLSGFETGTSCSSSTCELSDLSAAVEAISKRFDSSHRHIDALTKLVDQRSLFYNEPGTNIEAISAMFEDEDKEIESELKLVDGWIERHTIRQSQRRKHAEVVLGVLRSRRVETCVRYQALLQKRTEVLKNKVRRQTQFGTGGSSRRRGLSLGTPLFTFPINHDGQTSRADSQPTDTLDDSKPVLDPPMASNQQNNQLSRQTVRRRPRPGKHQQLASQQLFLEDQDQGVEHAQRRLSNARGIESEIEKISEIFRKFSALVVEQGESLRLIDDDVEAAALEVEEGHAHVAKTYNITKGNRGVIVKIFVTVLVLAVVLVKT